MFLNSFYVQKSKLILYPLLQFDKSDKRPKQTYVSYKDVVLKEDPILICSYEKNSIPGYEDFKENVILKNEYYMNQINTEEYDYITFDMSSYKEDYLHFLKGKYSKFSKDTKQVILDSYTNTTIGPLLVELHLKPGLYHDVFVDYFNEPIETMIEVHETLSPPDLEKEHVA